MRVHAASLPMLSGPRLAAPRLAAVAATPTRVAAEPAPSEPVDPLAPSDPVAPSNPVAPVEPPVPSEPSAPAEPTGKVRGVIRNLLAGHYKGVADVRLRINFADVLAQVAEERGAAPAPLAPAARHGAAYARFLAMYEAMNGSREPLDVTA